ncbi:hypothetical protein L6452_30030 [Arctium lappa]|uniref:Uncharacterized protein n=1 Tax=Arctium lappa TaxID=4217 RepID=A0ACB8ZHW4_ARCLA|nr:hypothetical protein L6452_30030 [Arctium lappa]
MYEVVNSYHPIYASHSHPSFTVVALSRFSSGCWKQSSFEVIKQLEAASRSQTVATSSSECEISTFLVRSPRMDVVTTSMFIAFRKEPVQDISYAKTA